MNENTNSHEDERPRTVDRRSTEQEQLRRLLQLGNQLANYVEVMSDPMFHGKPMNPNAVGMTLVSGFRRQLQQFQARGTLSALSRLRKDDDCCSVAGCQRLGFK